MEEQAEQNGVPSLKQISLIIVPCFVIKGLKCTCNKGILTIQIIGKCNFSPFSELFPWESKISDLFFLSFIFTQELRYATYGLETC